MTSTFDEMLQFLENAIFGLFVFFNFHCINLNFTHTSCN